MKHLIFLLLLLISIGSSAVDVKFSGLPLQAPSMIVPNDSFPFVQDFGPVMKRMKINDILGIPVFVNKFALYAPIANPTFTGTVSGVTKAHVGLGNVDNTSDLNKPISTATQAALDNKLEAADISGKADTTLSNLGTTAINANMMPATDFAYDLGSSTSRWASIWGDAGSFSGQLGLRDTGGNPILNSFITGYLGFNGAFWNSALDNTTYTAWGFRGRTYASGNSPTLILPTGNANGGNSGGVLVQIGTASGVRGKFQIKDGSEGTAGHVWTSVDTSGKGGWSALPSSGEANTASNLGLGSVLFKQKSGVDLQFRSLVAGSGITLTQNADDITIEAAGGGGANTSLSNLSGVSLNADLAWPDNGGGAAVTRTITTGSPSVPQDLNGSDNLTVETASGGFGSSGSLLFKTGPATNNGWGFGTVNSGSLTLEIGTASNGPGGRIKFKDNSNGYGTTGTVGHVWTQTAADGTGQWQAGGGSGEANTASNVGGANGVFKQKTGIDLEFKTLAAGANITITPVGDTLSIASTGGGGGGGVSFTEHWNGTFTPTSTNSTDTWVNVAVLTIPAAFNTGDELVVKMQAPFGSANGSGGGSSSIAIFDYNNNIIAQAYQQSAGTGDYGPVFLEARYTFTETVGTPIFRVKIKPIVVGTTAVCGYEEWTASGTGNEAENEFWAYKNEAGGNSALTVQDEGSTLSTGTTKINFVGAGVTATEPVADEITVTIPGAASAGWTSLIKTNANNGETLSNNDEVFADTTSAAFQLNLPATPTIGMRVRFVDKKGTWTTNNLTVGRNGSNIQGAAANFALNVNNEAVEFVYSDSTDGWLLITY